MFVVFIFLFVFESVFLQFYTPTEIKEETLPDERVSTFGNCVCDVTFNQCDPDCCCDPDCSIIELDQYSNCAPNTSIEVQSLMCEDDDVSWLFCVRTRMELLGTNEYFPNVDDITTSDSFNERASASEFMRSYSRTSSPHQGDNYLYGDPLLAYMNSSVTGTYEATFFSVPSGMTTSPDSVRNKVIIFGESLQKSSASFQYTSESDFSTYCSHYLNPQKYLETFIYRDATQASSTKVVFGDLKLYGGVTNESTTYNSTAQICHNAVKKVTYQIFYSATDANRRRSADDEDKYNSKSTIINVNVIVSEVQTIGYTQDSAVKVEYEVILIKYSETPASLLGVNASAILFRSGNPGYLFGKPVIVGLAVEQTRVVNKETVTRTGVAIKKNGLEVYTGTCQDEEFSSALEYGIDSEMNCKIGLTAAQLGSLCVSSDSPGNMTTILDSFDRVSKFGNPDMRVLTDWNAIVNQVSPNIGTGVFTDGRICSGMMNSVTYEFLSTRTGHESNPQWKIYGVKRTLDSEVWEYKHISDLTIVQDFYVKWKFVFLENPDQETSQLTIGTGINLSPLPEDTLAPFDLGGDSAS